LLDIPAENTETTVLLLETGREKRKGDVLLVFSESKRQDVFLIRPEIC